MLMLSVPLGARSAFFPDNGKYPFDLFQVTEILSENGANYITLTHPFVRKNEFYKFDKKRNEFQIKDWFVRDWFKLQDLFHFDQTAFINKQNAHSFTEAKRLQYARFLFDKTKFYHRKTVPSMKEWGGLTHPPVKNLTLPLVKYHEDFRPLNYQTISSPYFDPKLQNEIDNVSRSELTFRNNVRAYADRDVFALKMKLIRHARESILMSSLAFVCDKGTRELTNLLIEKHRQGVDVKIIADGMIGKALGYRECLQIMSRAGIDVIETKDFFKYKLKAIYHTKTLVVDLKEAVAGGHNMIDADNLSRGTDFMNRDVDLYVQGPMVTDIAKQFVENWNYQTRFVKNARPLSEYDLVIKNKLNYERKIGLRGKNFYQATLSNPDRRMDGVCRFIKQAPYEDRHTIGKAYLKLLDNVSKHLVITDPIKSDTYTEYPLFTDLGNQFDNFDMFNLLHMKVQGIARSGKKIDYITTNINMAGNENVAIMNEEIKAKLDAGRDLGANWSLFKLVASNAYYGGPHYRNLLKDWVPHKSVHIWKHISFMHSKIFYFDRIVASVGSYNFHHNATDQAYESTAICMDETLNRDLDQILVQDMVNSVPFIFSRLQ